MEKKIFLCFLIGIVVISLVGCETSGTGGSVTKLETKSDSGEVSVDITPGKYENGKFYVDVGINTHTVNNLNEYDLSEIVVLEMNGKTIKPVSAFQLSGHHNYGEMTFAVDEQPKTFTIKITGLHDPGVRTFSWP